MSASVRLSISNLIACILAVLWACASAVYNWGNVGGWVSPYFEQWYRVGEVVPYLCLAAWFATIALAIVHAWSRPSRALIAWVLASLALVPAAFFLATWITHRGFPPTSM